LQPGFEVQQLALLASVGAIFIHFLAPDEGGAIMHLVSTYSGTGKTTALQIAASVWGDIEGLRTSIDDTSASKFIKFGQIHHLPIIFYELVERDPLAAEELIRTFTEGREKSKARTGGKELLEAYRTWSTIMISAGNRSIVDTVSDKNAMSARVLEFENEFPKGMSKEQREAGRRYSLAVLENCGWAGEQILLSLFESPGKAEKIKTALDVTHDQLKEDFPAWAQRSRYWLRALASMYVAGQLMNSLGLISFNVERAIKWAGRQLEERNSQEIADRITAREALSDYLTQNLNVTLMMSGAFDHSIRKEVGVNAPVSGYPIPTKEVYIRREIDSRKIYIHKEHFRKWITENDQKASTIWRQLAEEKIILVPTAKVTLTAGTHLVAGQSTCLLIDGRCLE